MQHEGIKQIEIEKFLSEKEFNLLWSKIDRKIEKTRYKIGKWEVDKFTNLTGRYKNLILAEIELDTVDEFVEIPDWIDQEVTGYSWAFNNNLADWCVGSKAFELFQY